MEQAQNKNQAKQANQSITILSSNTSSNEANNARAS